MNSLEDGIVVIMLGEDSKMGETVNAILTSSSAMSEQDSRVWQGFQFGLTTANDQQQ